MTRSHAQAPIAAPVVLAMFCLAGCASVEQTEPSQDVRTSFATPIEAIKDTISCQGGSELHFHFGGSHDEKCPTNPHEWFNYVLPSTATITCRDVDGVASGPSIHVDIECGHGLMEGRWVRRNVVKSGQYVEGNPDGRWFYNYDFEQGVGDAKESLAYGDNGRLHGVQWLRDVSTGQYTCRCFWDGHFVWSAQAKDLEQVLSHHEECVLR